MRTMRRSWTNSSWTHSAIAGAVLCACVALSGFGPAAHGQRHSGGSSPPTAPPPHAGGTGPFTAVSSGLGAIQYVAVNYGVPPPQALARQLRAEDERSRAAALSAIGAPAQYLQRGHSTPPHSIQLELVALGTTDELNALLTAELDQHIVTAVLVEEDGNWRRVATLWYATSFDDPHTTPDTFVRTARSLLQHDRYRAIFHASASGPNGDYTENEAEVRVINNRAVVTLSFADAALECTQPAQPGHVSTGSSGCTATRRWLQADPADPSRRYLLVSATGKIAPREVASILGGSRDFQIAHVRTFSCQPFVYSDQQLRYEATAPSAPCPIK